MLEFEELGMNPKCSYQGCEREPHDAHDKCIMHLPKDKKDEHVFGREIRIQLSNNDFNFRGYVFPARVDFKQKSFPNANFEETTFHEYAEFQGANFHGATPFHKSKFLNGADFRGCQFHNICTFEEAKFENGLNFWGVKCGKSLSFAHATINGGFNSRELKVKGNFCSFEHTTIDGRNWDDEGILFFKMDIECDEINFSNCKIKSKLVIFDGSIMRAPVINFQNIDCKECKLHFSGVKFAGNVSFESAKFPRGAAWQYNTSFFGAEFIGVAVDFERASFGTVNFGRVKFSGFVGFTNNRIYGNLNFGAIELINPETRFIFKNPTFSSEENSSDLTGLNFSSVIFNEDRTNFEKFPEYLKYSVKFHNCQLRGVHFIANWMGCFEFRYSNIEDARFSANTWGVVTSHYLWIFPFIRKNVLREELEARKNIGAGEFRSVASLYQKLKVATDSTHEYQDSGAFYFNRFEVERTLLIRELDLAGSSTGSWWFRARHRMKAPCNIIRFFCSRLGLRFLLLTAYRIFAGYGEKPLWSFSWLFISTFVFAGLYSWLGFSIIKPSQPSETSKDFWLSLLFSISHLNIFQNSLKLGEQSFGPAEFTFWPLAINALNTIVLVVLFAFFAIGLQRQFKRF